jgi:hypothetical protein
MFERGFHLEGNLPSERSANEEIPDESCSRLCHGTTRGIGDRQLLVLVLNQYWEVFMYGSKAMYDRYQPALRQYKSKFTPSAACK